jgi:hypothetical protein
MPVLDLDCRIALTVTMITSIPMDTPEKPPLVIPPLTSRKDDGELYKRREEVEAELISTLPKGPAQWVKDKTQLKSESVVFLSRYIRLQDDEVAGRLQEELGARTVRMSKTWIHAIDKEGTEFIVSEVEAEIAELLLAEVPSRQSEYLEIGFGQTVYRHTMNAIERFTNSPFAHKGKVVKETYDEDGGDEIERPLERVADGGAAIDIELMWADWIEKGLRFVAEPKHREAIILRYLQGWPMTSKDPQQSCLTRYFKVSARQIQTWIDIALKQMRAGMMGEGYDSARADF